MQILPQYERRSTLSEEEKHADNACYATNSYVSRSAAENVCLNEDYKCLAFILIL